VPPPDPDEDGLELGAVTLGAAEGAGTGGATGGETAGVVGVVADRAEVELPAIVA
jgi:hypothetical protein